MALITAAAPSAAVAIAATVRNSNEGQKLGLKKPAHTFWVSSHVPGVSCHERIPLIQNRLPHDAPAYNNNKVKRSRRRRRGFALWPTEWRGSLAPRVCTWVTW